MPPLAQLTGTLELIAKAFTTSQSDPSSPLFKIYRKHSKINLIWKNETECQYLMPDPYYSRLPIYQKAKPSDPLKAGRGWGTDYSGVSRTPSARPHHRSTANQPALERSGRVCGCG